MSNHGLWTPPRSPRSSSPASNASGTPSPSLSQRSSAYFSADPSPIPAPPRRDSRVENPGRRVAQIIKLRPECVPQYKECHAKVWPEVLKQIRECGIRDCKITPPLSVCMRQFPETFGLGRAVTKDED